MNEQTSPTQPAPKPPTPILPFRKSHWKAMTIVGFSALLLWLLEFFYIFNKIYQEVLKSSLLSSFAFTGATLLGATLISSALFRWIPRWAQYWRIRRYLGLSGFSFILLHVFLAYLFANFNLRLIYFSFDPLKNPIIFGSIAFLILFVMAGTSSDWMMDHIGSKHWKFIHRFVYLAYIGSIFHFLTINPPILKTLPGYVLLAVSALAVFGMVYWWIRVSSKRNFRNTGFWVGLGLILLATALVVVVY